MSLSSSSVNCFTLYYISHHTNININADSTFYFIMRAHQSLTLTITIISGFVQLVRE
jgi:hypothetical protein